MNIQKYTPSILTLLFLVIVVVNADAQCAMCAATSAKSQYAKSLNQGILYLLFAPVFILGGVLLLWLKNKDKFKSEQ
jgi:threonine/homoserine/homoserine lactone efflux protein